MEVCVGLQVEHTAGMGRFRITKAETIGHGVQRIRADLIETEAAQSAISRVNET